MIMNKNFGRLSKTNYFFNYDDEEDDDVCELTFSPCLLIAVLKFRDGELRTFFNTLSKFSGVISPAANF